MVKTELYPAKDDTIHTVFINLINPEDMAVKLSGFEGKFEMCRNHFIGSTRLWLKWEAGENIVLTGSVREDGLFFHDEYSIFLPLRVDGIDAKSTWLESDKATICGRVRGKHLAAVKSMLADVVSIINLAFSQNHTEQSIRDVLGDELFEKHFTVRTISAP